jgi:hypothetical protein
MTTAHRATHSAQQASYAASRALDSDWLQAVGRLGWVAKAAIYTVFGLLAFQVAKGTTNEEADPSGAVHQIAQSGAGRAVLVALAAGLVLYAMWRLACAVLPGEWGPTDLAKRAGYVLSGLVYGALAATTTSIISAGAKGQGGGETTDSKVQSLSADLMARSWGRGAVALAGLVVIGVGVGFAVYGVTRKDEEQLDHSRMSQGTRRLVHHLGPIGWLARALVTAFVGVFFLQAALNYDPEQAQGFDGALRQVASGGWVWLVALTGVGLVVYGVYCLITARYRVLRAP